MPTVLIAVPTEHQTLLERSFFWRADMRRTFARPPEVFDVARTLGPDVIIVMRDDAHVRGVIEDLRREVVTRDSVVVVLSPKLQDAGALEASGATLVLPHDFSEAGEAAPWHERLEKLLQLRQRRESRVPADFPVDVWVGEANAKDRKQLVARALNLSSRGILLDIPEPLALQSRIDVRFAARTSLPEVSVVGEVVRVAQTADGHRLAGVHFVVVRKDARLAIRDTLRALRPFSPAADDNLV